MDNDPLVMVHARALLDSSPEGRTAYIEADLERRFGGLGHAGRPMPGLAHAEDVPPARSAETQMPRAAPRASAKGM